MRDYGKVHTSFWTSETTRSMSEDARTLALYLITSPHSNISGAFRLPDGYVCDDIQWNSSRVTKGFAELLAKGFARRCETSKWVWIIKHLEWNPPENPNQRKSAVKIVEMIPNECSWKQEYMSLSAEILGIEYEPLNNGCETLIEPEAVTVTGTEAITGTEKPSRTKKDFVLPDWINQQHWDAWHMHPKRKKLSNEQKQLAIDQLLEWKNLGLDYAKALKDTATNGWQGLFEPKTPTLGKSKMDISGIDYTEGVNPDGTF